MPANIEGRVMDNQRRLLGGVAISRAGKVVGNSQPDGTFSVPVPKSSGRRFVLTFAAEGHVTNTRVFDPWAVCRRTVRLWPVAYRLRFDPARGLDATLGGARIQVPPNALVGPEGKGLRGPVELRFTLLDVTTVLGCQAAPGDFSGTLRNGKAARLDSYGIFDLSVEDAKGRRLALARGAKVGLAIPVPPKLAEGAPKKIGFFGFDPREGRWTQRGDFTYKPGDITYNGSIENFPDASGSTAYNLDGAQNIVCVQVTVQRDYDGAPMGGCSVEASDATTVQYLSGGTTDAYGNVCLLVRRNSQFKVTAYCDCCGTVPGAEPVFTAPDFSSDATACGNSALCPNVGPVMVSVIVG
jgi:hypothetical protein